ncbi:helix-turn-helix domain-containing protein [Kribbella sp. DT2]|uniref:helix-turn-helix domain-containing protein n=1 Tax=Kribbella sp. DT2 TaxID=3393427 RepID=UPI003CF7EDFD
MAKRSPVADVVMHPVRLRIIQQLAGRELTTAQLRTALPEITQATLYRHVAALVEAGILAVVAERRVRGTTERTLTLGERMAHADLDELRTMSQGQLQSAFLAFLSHLGEGFDRFLASEDQALREYVGFGQTQLYVTAEDLPVIQAGFAELLAPYLTDQGDAGRLRVALNTALIPDPAPPADQ